MLPSSIIEQWPIFATALIIIGALFKIIIALYDTRIAELKANYQAQIEGLQKQINYLQGYREYADISARIAEKTADTARTAAHLATESSAK